MLKRSLILSFFILCSSIASFEGYNIVLDAPETQRAAACAIRYVPTTTEITVSDLNPATPMNVRSCAGRASKVEKSTASTASMQASPIDYKWCFEGEDKRYRISFRGDQLSGGKTVVYDWISTPEPNSLGSYNVRDFGAVGDGRADDTIAIQSAIAFMATRNGGILSFPEGDYPVSAPITLASGVTLQGVNSLPTNYPTNNVNGRNPSRIRLTGARRALFRMGECTYRVALRDLELTADSNDLTYGVEAVGAYNSSMDTYFERVTFSLFYRGIYARGLPQTDLAWQFDYVKIKNCLFALNRDAGIYTNTRNSGWII